MTYAFFIFFILYLFLIVVLGLSKSLNVKTLKEYSVGHKNYSTPILVAMLVTTMIGANSTFTVLDTTSHIGLIFFLVCVTETISKIIIGLYIAPKIARYSSAISVGDIIKVEYGVAAQVITSIFSIIYSVTLVAIQIICMSHILTYYFKLDADLVLMLTLILLVTYTSIGGFKAISISSVVHFITVVVIFPAIFNLIIIHFGGLESIKNDIFNDKILFYKNTMTYPEILALISTAVIPSFRPATVQRYLLTTDSDQIKRAMTIAAVIHIPFYLIMFFFSLLVVKFQYDSSTAILNLGKDYLPFNMHILLGLSLLAMIMSLADSNLNTASICLVNDLINPLLPNLQEKDKLNYARLSSVVFVVIAYYASLTTNNGFNFILFAKQFWVPLVAPAITLALFRFRYSLHSIYAGGIVGIFSSVYFNTYCINEKPWVSGVFLGTVLNLLTVLILNLSPLPSHTKILKEKHESKTPYNGWSYFGTMFLKIVKNISITNLVTYSKTKVETFGAPYDAFAVFQIIIFLFPIILNDAHAYEITIIKIIAGLLCTILLLRSFFSEQFNYKYLPLYWHFTTLFCLSFMPVFVLLDSHFTGSAYNFLIISVLLLAIILDATTFYINLIIGTLAAFFVYIASHASIEMPNDKIILNMIYGLGLSISVIVVFVAKNKVHYKRNMEIAKLIGSSIAHEMRTILLVLQTNTSYLKNNLEQTPISEGIADTLNSQLFSIRKAFTMIDMLLVRFKYFESHNFDKKTCDLNQIIIEAVKEYPLIKSERKLIHINSSESTIYIVANEILMKHVIFNLIKNALYQISKHMNGDITITLQEDFYNDYVIFEDSLGVLAPNKMGKLYTPFYFYSDKGTGIGLSYCKYIVEEHGFKFDCQVQENICTKFIITIPKISKN